MLDLLDITFFLEILLRIVVFLIKLVVYPIAWILGLKPKWSTMFDLKFEREK